MEIAPSIGFDGRTSLTFQEIASCLACTAQHVFNLVETGAVVRQKYKIRDALKAKRLPADSYRRFLGFRCTSRTPDFSAAAIPWPCCDFPGGTARTTEEIGKKLNITATLVAHYIRDGRLVAYDLKGRDSTRSMYRIPIESYRVWFLSLIIKPRSA